ncbi:MAG: hypothetical protein O7D86_08675 [Proteobacteria bacterium]|nr:hypothetical protein [Pseudomonadota bacterium]
MSHSVNDVGLITNLNVNEYFNDAIHDAISHHKLYDLNNKLLNELRRFYRLGQEDKIRYINQLH